MTLNMAFDLNLWPRSITASMLSLIIGSTIGLFILRSVYRLFFHPLSHVPGPPLAAISHAYEFYHDAIRNGMYIWEIEKMHERYGEPTSHVFVSHCPNFS